MKTLDSLVPRLIVATQEGRLKWRRRPRGGYETPLLDALVISVDTWQDNDTGLNGVALTLRRQSGNMLGPPDEDLDNLNATEVDPRGDELFHLLSLARRSANDVDRLISEIESFLE